ncbi:phenylalanyl-tRNA synthetase, beta subunit [Agrilactobacillus composti DSM 18527 = JCM 14202]|uniref:Phenylalanine--tRNA ligase beta subunit n=1 Tax=Agrilactobacillus composti DSM 18527 = JCM 14202 TaxID=1423734 RepID=X0PPS5_9LACO|nr:phenylalanine--tRNA ligase subunit beta [Agrilactobacillus composti]KRM35811.1 phenylalanyl-tRNA synthetase, beta subunit [Agrilactobacillus composti DSM 18527 = JCM 14202]GAF39682.1 phenylalanyl-tRNA synthetase beta chain [Agrilactobacillus composti DSM 18527 = JCM 14202]
MKISYKWLQEYINLNENPDVLADKVSLTGIEVAGVRYPDKGLKKIVVGHVNSIEPHPDSDHLNICQVEVGESEPYQIVCGAPNVAAGQDVIVALPGSRIANNVKIKKSKMRGVESKGMICALQEIGFPDNVVPKEYANGIYVFTEPVKVGEPVFKYLGMDDAILDFDITPNRADTLGMHGTAWEVGAMYHEKPTFKQPELTETNTKAQDLLRVSVENKAVVPGYYLRIVENVQIKPSPMWLQIHLWNAGIRPINNVVDITNYIMLAYGQPMHAFDYDKLTRKEILVRDAKAGEVITSLDGEGHQLDPEDIVITDGVIPTGIAGVMGGLDSEITASSKTVVLEAAVFNGTRIRKTAQRHNLRTDASTRFEKGIDTASVTDALNAAASLLAQLADGAVAQGILVGNDIQPKDAVIAIRLARINHILGTELTLPQVQAIFENLGFGVTISDTDLMTVSVPPRRWDISIEADLVEEVARMYGYDNLPATLPKIAMTPGKFNPQQRFIRRSKTLLQSAGLSEVISYALTTRAKAQQFTMTADTALTKLDWPMTEDHAYLRLNLVSGLLNDIAYNVARNQTDLAIYEQGRAFTKKAGQIRPIEREYLAGAVTGLVSGDNWAQGKQVVDFYYLKGILDTYLADHDYTGDISYVANTDRPELHPGRCADVYVGEQFVGFIGQVHPATAKAYAIPETYVFQLDLSTLLALPTTTLVSQSAPKYPATSRDIAVLLPDTVTNAQVEAIIKRRGGQHLQNIHLFDVYAGKNIEAGHKSLAYSLTFQNPEATLTESEINEQMTHIIAYLTETLHAEIR